ncbi:hypothetical protein D3C78_1691030 [compost metagenome]
MRLVQFQLADDLVRGTEHQVLTDRLGVVAIAVGHQFIGYRLGEAVVHGADVLHQVLEGAPVVDAVAHGHFPVLLTVVDTGAALHHEARARYLGMVGHRLA